jgi:hypothetical protein
MQIETVTLTNVIWRRQTSLLSGLLLPAILVLGACLIEACSPARPAKPDIPTSISPGWKLSSLDKAPPPPEVSGDGSPECWKARYTAEGPADLWICWYRAPANAFEAVQRVRAEAQTVKFQEGRYFILVKWNNVPKASLTALVRGIEKALQPPK